jgi:hypothetical protein
VTDPIKVPTKVEVFWSEDDQCARARMGGYVLPDGYHTPAITAALAECERRNRKPSDRWQHPGSGSRYVFSEPTLYGFRATDVTAADTQGYVWAAEPYYRKMFAAAKPWHRANCVLGADECYPPGELPRKMQPNEIRMPDGSAGRMTYTPVAAFGKPDVQFGKPNESGSYQFILGGPGSREPGLYSKEHPCHDPSQRARAEEFLKKAKEESDAERPETGRVRPAPEAMPRVQTEGDAAGLGAGREMPSVSTETQVADITQAPAPKDELPEAPIPEDVFLAPGWPPGHRHGWGSMFVEGGELVVFHGRGEYRLTRAELVDRASNDSNPLGWPRALAYYEKQVKAQKRADNFARAATSNDPIGFPLEPIEVPDVFAMLNERLYPTTVRADDGSECVVDKEGRSFSLTWRLGRPYAVCEGIGRFLADELESFDPTQRTIVRAFVEQGETKATSGGEVPPGPPLDETVDEVQRLEPAAAVPTEAGPQGSSVGISDGPEPLPDVSETPGRSILVGGRQGGKTFEMLQASIRRENTALARAEEAEARVREMEAGLSRTSLVAMALETTLHRYRERFGDLPADERPKDAPPFPGISPQPRPSCVPPDATDWTDLPHGARRLIGPQLHLTALHARNVGKQRRRLLAERLERRADDSEQCGFDGEQFRRWDYDHKALRAYLDERATKLRALAARLRGKK